MTDYVKNDTRNPAGVKDSANLYRTFGGAHYVHWEIDPSADYIKALRAAGVRCRRVGCELFVHHEDQKKAEPVPGHH